MLEYVIYLVDEVGSDRNAIISSDLCCHIMYLSFFLNPLKELVHYISYSSVGVSTCDI